mgnify:FL=1
MSVTVYEVGPRDGLQSIKPFIDTDIKRQLISALYEAGLENIEEVSFAHPRLVPQMSDAEDVFTGMGAGLVMNRRGFERARIINVEKINLVISPCETFSMQNLGKPHSEVVHEYWSFMNGYPKDKVRVYISMAFGSPNCSEVTEKRMKMMLKDAALFGNTVVFSDTIGIGCTDDVHKWTRMARDENLTPALHLHHKGDESRPLQLIRAGLIAGITEFDSSIGGLGGCPFAKGSGANLSTETLVRHLNSWGIDCGLNEVSLGKAAKIAWKIKNTIAIAI